MATFPQGITENLISAPVKDFYGALNYANPDLVQRFARTKGLAINEAERYFRECKKMLILMGSMKDPFSPSQPLDEIWHHFILHTREYEEYCKTYIGRFLHHNPTDVPYVESRTRMLGIAKMLFKEIDVALWPSMETLACDSSCKGDNYCKGD